MKKKTKWVVEATKETVEGEILTVCFDDRNDAYSFADFSLDSLAVEKGLTTIECSMKIQHKQVAA